MSEQEKLRAGYLPLSAKEIDEAEENLVGCLDAYDQNGEEGLQESLDRIYLWLGNRFRGPTTATPSGATRATWRHGRWLPRRKRKRSGCTPKPLISRPSRRSAALITAPVVGPHLPFGASPSSVHAMRDCRPLRAYGEVRAHPARLLARRRTPTAFHPRSRRAPSARKSGF